MRSSGESHLEISQRTSRGRIIMANGNIFKNLNARSNGSLFYLRQGYLFCFVFLTGRKRSPLESVVDFIYKHASIFKNARELNHGRVPAVARLKYPKSSQVFI